MEPDSAPSATVTPVLRHARHRWWLVIGILVALIVVFEEGIRHVPPDGMTVTGIGDPEALYSSAPFTCFYTAPKDQQSINDFYASLNAAPAFIFFFSRPVNCALTPPPTPTSIAFTWHGIPLETWYTGNCVVGDTAGGFPDFLLIGHFWYPDGPLPPPAPK